jgi:cytochrome c oxidase subunit 1
VGSILFGKRIPETERASEQVKPAPRAAPVVATYGSAGTINIPGTIVLVAVFFTAFVLYYFVNWKYLSEIWPLR